MKKIKYNRQQNKCYPKGVRLSEKQLQHSVMKYNRSNKFYFCYYGKENSLRLKSIVASKLASKQLWGTIYFAGGDTWGKGYCKNVTKIPIETTFNYINNGMYA